MRVGRGGCSLACSLTRALGSAFGAAALGACSLVGPTHERPAVAIPAEYREAGALWKTAKPSDVIQRGAWWALYEDPQLNALAARVAGANQDVRQAEARVRQAQAVVRQALAQRYPFVSGGGTANRSRVVNNGPGTSSSFELAVDASWEPDLWGRVRRSIESRWPVSRSRSRSVCSG